MSALSEQILQQARLVSLPDVYLRLKAVVEDPDSNLADITDVVGSDPALTARLLRLVNSAYFGLATEIASISRAISLLGTQEVHDLALAVAVADTFDGLSNIPDMYGFWHRSVTVGIASREIASASNVLDSESLFVCGLLHDIGHLFVYQVAAGQAGEAIERAAEQRIPLYQAERAVLGMDYAEIGAELMRMWQLPQSLWEPTQYHVVPRQSQDFTLSSSVVHIARALTEVSGDAGAEAHACARIDPFALEITGLSVSQSVEIFAKIEPQVGAVTALIFPRLRAA